MAKVEGRLQTLAIGAGPTAIGSLTDCTLNGEVAELDSTSHDDADETALPGRGKYSISGDVLWDEADAGQAALATAFFAKTNNLALRFRMNTGSGLKNYAAVGFVTKFAPAGPNKDLGKMSFAIRISGTPTVTNQP